MTDRMNTADFLQIEDTPEFANFENSIQETSAIGAPALVWPDDHAEVYDVPEGDDNSKIPLLSDAQWAHICAQLGIDPSFSF